MAAKYFGKPLSNPQYKTQFAATPSSCCLIERQRRGFVPQIDEKNETAAVYTNLQYLKNYETAKADVSLFSEVAPISTIQIPTEDGRTALMIAAAKDADPEVVRLLIANGADPNIQTENGRTALMAAAANVHREVAV